MLSHVSQGPGRTRANLCVEPTAICKGFKHTQKVQGTPCVHGFHVCHCNYPQNLQGGGGGKSLICSYFRLLKKHLALGENRRQPSWVQFQVSTGNPGTCPLDTRAYLYLKPRCGVDKGDLGNYWMHANSSRGQVGGCWGYLSVWPLRSSDFKKSQGCLFSTEPQNEVFLKGTGLCVWGGGETGAKRVLSSHFSKSTDKANAR